MAENESNPATPSTPSTLDILHWCVQYAGSIFVLWEGRPGEAVPLCDLPDDVLLFYLDKFVKERQLPHRVLRGDEVVTRVQ